MADLLVKLYGALPAIAALTDVRVRRATPADKPALLAWLTAQTGWPPGWRAEAEAAFTRQPATCFVASERQATPANGYVTTPERLLGFCCWDAVAKGFFGPAGVAASHQGRGVGRALLLAALHAMRDDGYGYAIIGWAGSVGFYKRVAGAIEIPGSEPGVYPPPLA